MRQADTNLLHNTTRTHRGLAFVLVVLACCLPVLTHPGAANAIDRWEVWRSENVDPEADLFSVRWDREIWGTLPTPPVVGEVAIDQHEMYDGDVLPLSVFPSDGTPATEDEMFWTCALLDLSLECSSSQPGGAQLVASFTGRTLDLIVNWRDGVTGITPSRPPKILVTVVAIRESTESAAETESFGDIKTMFR